MQVPEWLLSMIYRCLRKKPDERFATGSELYNYIVTSSVGIQKAEILSGNNPWQYQAEKLLKEKQQLQQQLSAAEAELSRLRMLAAAPAAGERYPGQDDYPVSRKKNTSWLAAFILTLAVASGLAYALVQSNKQPREKVEKKPVAVTTTVKPPQQTTAIGEYRVNAPVTYFHNEPDPATRRKAFLSKGDPVTALDDQQDFIYTEFTNSRGQTSKGWLPKSTLVTLEDWKAAQDRNRPPSTDEIRTQLVMAAGYVRTNQLEEALTIYNFLTPFEVPEALYHASNFALQGKNEAVNCSQGLTMLNRSSELGYLPAKRTLGMLYLFAENPAWLQINGYNQCNYGKDVAKARGLLSQAANGGDTTARQILEELNLSTTVQ
ncbi:MAG TPA: hypothetical protein VEX65_04790, partial [Flavisolibacter sp.]|nr:hypothetical protein [Flavisolibacter sp.]